MENPRRGILAKHAGLQPLSWDRCEASVIGVEQGSLLVPVCNPHSVLPLLLCLPICKKTKTKQNPLISGSSSSPLLGGRSRFLSALE